jgi:hypothetical protein
MTDSTTSSSSSSSTAPSQGRQLVVESSEDGASAFTLDEGLLIGSVMDRLRYLHRSISTASSKKRAYLYSNLLVSWFCSKQSNGTNASGSSVVMTIRRFTLALLCFGVECDNDVVRGAVVVIFASLQQYHDRASRVAVDSAIKALSGKQCPVRERFTIAMLKVGWITSQCVLCWYCFWSSLSLYSLSLSLSLSAPLNEQGITKSASSSNTHGANSVLLRWSLLLVHNAAELIFQNAANEAVAQSTIDAQFLLLDALQDARTSVRISFYDQYVNTLRVCVS